MANDYQTISLKELLEAGRITIKAANRDAHKRVRDELEGPDGDRYRVSPVDTSLTISGDSPRLIFRSHTSPLTKLVISNPHAIELNSEYPDPLSFYIGGSQYRLVAADKLGTISRTIFEFKEAQE